MREVETTTNGLIREANSTDARQQRCVGSRIDVIANAGDTNAASGDRSSRSVHAGIRSFEIEGAELLCRDEDVVVDGSGNIGGDPVDLVIEDLEAIAVVEVRHGVGADSSENSGFRRCDRGAVGLKIVKDQHANLLDRSRGGDFDLIAEHHRFVVVTTTNTLEVFSALSTAIQQRNGGRGRGSDIGVGTHGESSVDVLELSDRATVVDAKETAGGAGACP